MNKQILAYGLIAVGLYLYLNSSKTVNDSANTSDKLPKNSFSSLNGVANIAKVHQAI